MERQGDGPSHQEWLSAGPLAKSPLRHGGPAILSHPHTGSPGSPASACWVLASDLRHPGPHPGGRLGRGQPPASRPGAQSRPEADAWGGCTGPKARPSGLRQQRAALRRRARSPECGSLLDASSESRRLWLEPRRLARESHRRQGLGFCEDLVEEELRPRQRRLLRGAGLSASGRPRRVRTRPRSALGCAPLFGPHLVN